MSVELNENSMENLLKVPGKRPRLKDGKPYTLKIKILRKRPHSKIFPFFKREALLNLKRLEPKTKKRRLPILLLKVL